MSVLASLALVCSLLPQSPQGGDQTGAANGKAALLSPAERTSLRKLLVTYLDADTRYAMADSEKERETTLRKREGRSGYYTVALNLRDRFAAHGAWSADELRTLTAAGVAGTLAQDPGHELMALFARSLDPVDLQGHTYVPAMRRILRLSLGTRGDAWNATDYLYEDVGGYLGAVEWMNWKLVGQKTMLMPMHGGAKHGKDPKLNYDVDAWPHWNPKLKWEPRPVYVLEVTPKFSDYPYSRMLILVDAETYTIPYKEAFDKKGELWKIILNSPKQSPDPNSKPQEMGAHMAIDLQAEHATIISARSQKSNTGIDPERFTVNSLKKRGH